MNLKLFKNRTYVFVLPSPLPLYPPGLNVVSGGALRGCGRQALGALMHLCGWWGFAVPLAAWLGLHKGMGPFGFWVALASGSSLQVRALQADAQPIDRCIALYM